MSEVGQMQSSLAALMAQSPRRTNLSASSKSDSPLASDKSSTSFKSLLSPKDEKSFDFDKTSLSTPQSMNAVKSDDFTPVRPGVKPEEQNVGEAVDNLGHRQALQAFLQKLKKEFGLGAEDVLQAFSQLTTEELFQPPEQSLEKIIQSLPLMPEQRQEARQLFQGLLKETASQDMADYLKSSKRQLSLEVLSQGEARNRRLEAGLQKMQSEFFANPQAQMMQQQAVQKYQAVQEVDPNADEDQSEDSSSSGVGMYAGLSAMGAAVAAGASQSANSASAASATTAANQSQFSNVNKAPRPAKLSSFFDTAQVEASEAQSSSVGTTESGAANAAANAAGPTAVAPSEMADEASASQAMNPEFQKALNEMQPANEKSLRPEELKALKAKLAAKTEKSVLKPEETISNVQTDEAESDLGFFDQSMKSALPKEAPVKGEISAGLTAGAGLAAYAASQANSGASEKSKKVEASGPKVTSESDSGKIANGRDEKLSLRSEKEAALDNSTLGQSQVSQAPENKSQLKPESFVINTKPTNEQEAKNIKDVINQAQFLARKGGGEMKVTLSPEGLGQVSMKVAVEGGQVSVQMVADTMDAKKILERGLGDLKATLATHNLRVDQIRVETPADVSRQLAQNHDEAQRQFAHQFMEQFRQDNNEWRRGFYDLPGAKQYRSQAEEAERIAMPSSSSQRRREGSRRLDLVA